MKHENDRGAIPHGPRIEYNQCVDDCFGYYIPKADKIVLRDNLEGMDKQVLLHEMVHATGHKSRLNREFMNIKTNDDGKRLFRLLEELVATTVEWELGDLAQGPGGIKALWIEEISRARQVLEKDVGKENVELLLEAVQRERDRVIKYLLEGEKEESVWWITKWTKEGRFI